MTLLSKAVKIIDKTTKSLKIQPEVLHHSTTDDGNGNMTQVIATQRAVVGKKQRLVRNFDGREVTCNTTITFVDPTVSVKEGDLIYLQDGSGGPVIGTDSPFDDSGKLITEAYLG